MAELVLVERRGTVRVLTFNRPEKLNALSTPMLEELERALDDARDDLATRVVILTGAGDRAFVAGADIGEYAEQTDEAFDAFQRFCRRLFDALDAFPKPVIAAVNGYALGGGFEIALCCDLLMASANARFGLPEGLLGLSPGGGGTQRLTRAAGPSVAADVLLSARRLTADEALRSGIVSEVVEPNALLDAALAKAGAIVKGAPLAVREMLELVRVASETPLAEGLDREHEALVRLRRTADAAEGVRAFVEKREPRFEGR
ncbi:MAG TPA: enoyl-CoA hydratase-related protein [Actinomycetota bacterium]|nr:enoyl-CoA hydratase-related protein [Actinomycetota bacterium]